MRLWRLCRRAHAAFDGEGARLFGGRWNPRGTPVVYTSATVALATLEYLVNLDAEDAPGDLVLIAADLPRAFRVEEVRVDALPRDWRRTPPPEQLARIGAEWARERRSPVLSVPSAVVPLERNYLLNPAYPGFASLRIARPQGFTLDRRIPTGHRR